MPSEPKSKKPRPKAPPGRRAFVSFTRILALLIVALFLLRMFNVFESFAFYVPGRTGAQPPAHVEPVTFTSDGLTIHGWFIPARGSSHASPAPAVLHCHGNAGDMGSHIDYAEFIVGAGVSVFMFDYRGYGDSGPGGTIRSRQAFMRDTRAAFDHLKSRADVDRARLGVYGVSLGANFAAALAAEDQDVKAVCLVSPFSTWRGVASDHAPVIGGLLIRPGLDVMKSVTRLGQRPLLVVHSRADEVIPFYHAEVVARAATSAGVSVEAIHLDGLGHNDVPMNDERATSGIAEFFRNLLR